MRRLLTRLGLAGGRCALCANQHSGTTRLCPDCARALQPRTGGYCPDCGAITDDTTAPPTRCAMCRIQPPRWDRLYFHGVYGEQLRDMILRFKFKGGIELTQLFGSMLAERIDNPAGIEALVPVPLHRSRLRWRGFNQSLLLARAVSRLTGIPMAAQGLQRIRATRPQTELSHKERRGNIRGAFSMDNGLKGKRVLIVDDVLTTGATLEECARTLRRGRAAGVEAMVVAVADGNGREHKK